MLDQALVISPSVAAIHNMRGVILATRLKRYREASAALMMAVELAPGNMTYKKLMNNCLLKISSKEPTKALNAVSKLKSFLPKLLMI